MIIEALQIDDYILDKIESRHRIAFYEVEQACYYTQRPIRRGRERLYNVFSRTEEGRYVLVVLANLGRGIWQIVTAREMTD